MIVDLFARGGSDKPMRSVVKTLSWRIIAGLDTFAISWFVTGKLLSAATIIGVEALTKMLWYYLHERGWDHITWGRSRGWGDHLVNLHKKILPKALGGGED